MFTYAYVNTIEFKGYKCHMHMCNEGFTVNKHYHYICLIKTETADEDKNGVFLKMKERYLLYS